MALDRQSWTRTWRHKVKPWPGQLKPNQGRPLLRYIVSLNETAISLSLLVPNTVFQVFQVCVTCSTLQDVSCIEERLIEGEEWSALEWISSRFEPVVKERRRSSKQIWKQRLPWSGLGWMTRCFLVSPQPFPSGSAQATNLVSVTLFGDSWTH